MKICIHPIATITKISGLNGDVRLRPLSRYFEEHIESNRLLLLELITGLGKKRRFKFRGVDNVNDAKSIVGKTLYVQTDTDDDINLISKNLIGYNVVTNTGVIVGELTDFMWLPSNDVYVIKNGKKEYLIPIIPEVIKKLDHSQMTILISPMDGLLD